MHKSELQDLDISEDTALDKHEKETSISIGKSDDTVRLHTDVSTMMKWILSIEESEILSHRTKDGDLVGLKAEVPKGVLKFQSNARKSNATSQMVSYGPNK